MVRQKQKPRRSWGVGFLTAEGSPPPPTSSPITIQPQGPSSGAAPSPSELMLKGPDVASEEEDNPPPPPPITAEKEKKEEEQEEAALIPSSSAAPSAAPPRGPKKKWRAPRKSAENWTPEMEDDEYSTAPPQPPVQALGRAKRARSQNANKEK